MQNKSIDNQIEQIIRKRYGNENPSKASNIKRSPEMTDLCNLILNNQKANKPICKQDIIKKFPQYTRLHINTGVLGTEILENQEQLENKIQQILKPSPIFTYSLSVIEGPPVRYCIILAYSNNKFHIESITKLLENNKDPNLKLDETKALSIINEFRKILGKPFLKKSPLDNKYLTEMIAKSKTDTEFYNNAFKENSYSLIFDLAPNQKDLNIIQHNLSGYYNRRLLYADINQVQISTVQTKIYLIAKEPETHHGDELRIGEYFYVDPFNAQQAQNQVSNQNHQQPQKFEKTKPQKEEEQNQEKPKTTQGPILRVWKTEETESTKPKQETPAQTESPKPEQEKPKKESKKPVKISKSGQDQKNTPAMERVTPEIQVVPDNMPWNSSKSAAEAQNFHKENSNSSQKPQRNTNSHQQKTERPDNHKFDTWTPPKKSEPENPAPATEKPKPDQEKPKSRKQKPNKQTENQKPETQKPENSNKPSHQQEKPEPHPQVHKPKHEPIVAPQELEKQLNEKLFQIKQNKKLPIQALEVLRQDLQQYIEAIRDGYVDFKRDKLTEILGSVYKNIQPVKIQGSLVGDKVVDNAFKQTKDLYEGIGIDPLSEKDMSFMTAIIVGSKDKKEYIGTVVFASISDDMNQDIILHSYLNSERARHGLSALMFDPKIREFAVQGVKYMIEQKRIIAFNDDQKEVLKQMENSSKYNGIAFQLAIPENKNKGETLVQKIQDETAQLSILLGEYNHVGLHISKFEGENYYCGIYFVKIEQ